MAVDQGERLSVCVIHAQPDQGFATELMAGLSMCGLATQTLNTTGLNQRQKLTPLSPNEKKLVSEEILNADTVVFILSVAGLTEKLPRAAIEIAAKFGKKIILLPIESVPQELAPHFLLKLPFITSDTQHNFASGLVQLVDLIKTEIEWTKEHTRLCERAYQWQSRNRAKSLLLSGKEVIRAANWATKQPDGQGRMTHLLNSFISASIHAHNGGQTTNHRKSSSLATMAAILALTAFSLLAGTKWYETTTKFNAMGAQLRLVETSHNQLSNSHARLLADIRIPPIKTDNASALVQKDWYVNSSKFAGATGQLQYTQEDSQLSPAMTGILLDGNLISPSYSDEILLLTPHSMHSIDPGLLSSLNQDNNRNPYYTPAAFHSDNQNEERVMLAMVEQEFTPPLEPVFILPALKRDTRLEVGSPIWTSAPIDEMETSFSLFRIKSADLSGISPLGYADIHCNNNAMTDNIIGLFSLPQPSADLDTGFANLLFSTLQNANKTGEVVYDSSKDFIEPGTPIFSPATGKLIALHVSQTRNHRNSLGRGITLQNLIDTIRTALPPQSQDMTSMCKSL